jgi:predicted nucleic acid-binding protein
MLVVADTSPLNYLVLIGCIDILPQLHEKVLIPSAVRRELLSFDAPPAVREWATKLPAWAEEVAPAPEFLHDPQLVALHDGEREALALAASRQPIFLLIDEWPARSIAIRKGFLVIGTLGVLDQAARRKLISFAEAIDKLKRTSFRYPSSIVERLLAEHDSGK